LPSATLGKDHTAKFQPAKRSLPSAIFRALGKGFAECRHSAKIKTKKFKKKTKKNEIKEKKNLFFQEANVQQPLLASRTPS